MLTTVAGSILEVYLLLQCNVINLHVLANCCVWNERQSTKKVLRNNCKISVFRSAFVHTKYTSNMADDNDVIALHV